MDYKNATDTINKARNHFFDDYIKLGMKRQPNTKPRDEEQRIRMLAIEADIIKSRIDMSHFSPAPEEVVKAYAHHK